MKLGINVKIGIAAGLANCIAWYLIARQMNYYSFYIEQYRYYVTLILLVIGVPLSVFFERKSMNGFLEFKAALKTGVLYCIVLSLIVAVFNFIYYKFIVPDAIDYFVSEVKKSLLENKVKEEELPERIELVRSYFGSFRLFMSTLIIGLLISLASGAVLKKNNPQAFESN